MLIKIKGLWFLKQLNTCTSFLNEYIVRFITVARWIFKVVIIVIGIMSVFKYAILVFLVRIMHHLVKLEENLIIQKCNPFIRLLFILAVNWYQTRCKLKQ